MQRHKSQRHVNAAKARWRAAEARAQTERDAGIPDMPLTQDMREPFALDLRSAGYRNLRIEPRLGYVAWRAVDADTDEVVRCAAIKELLRWVASQVPRQLGARHWQ
jgi:hypothetical protein